MLTLHFRIVRFRHPMRPGCTRPPPGQRGGDKLWGYPEHTYGGYEARTSRWGIRRREEFHLQAVWGGVGESTKKAFIEDSK